MVTRITRSWLGIAGGAVALVGVALFVGCGGSSKNVSQGTTPAPVKSQPLTAVPSGRYVAQLSSSGLEAKGVDVVGVGPGGTWRLIIGRRKLSFIPPGRSATTYSVVRLTTREITLGPNPECSKAVGRTQDSVFDLVQSGGGLRFSAVKEACREDVGALAVAPWHKQ